MYGGQENHLNKILAGDMQDLDAVRHNYEAQAQAFSRWYNAVLSVVSVCGMVLILSSFYWLSVITFLAGALLTYMLKTKQLAAQKHIVCIDHQIRQKSLEALGNATYSQN